MEENEKLIANLEREISTKQQAGEDVSALNKRLKQHQEIISDHLSAVIAIAIDKEKLSPTNSHEY